VAYEKNPRRRNRSSKMKKYSSGECECYVHLKQLKP
jgi:hypothetical protein